MKPKKVKLGRRVYIEWVDSASDYGWQTEYGNRNCTVISTGILIYLTKEYVTITTSVADNGQVNSPVTIPWIAITKFNPCEVIAEIKEN